MKDISPWRIQRNADPNDLGPEYAYSPAIEEEAHLRDYWKILVKRRGLILTVVFVIFGIVAYINFTATPLYIATATLKIEPQNPMVTGIGEMQGLAGGGQYDYYQTQFSLLESRTLAAMVVTELNLESDRAFANARVVKSNPITRIRSWTFGYLYYFIDKVDGLLSWWRSNSNDNYSAKAPDSGNLQGEVPGKPVETSNNTGVSQRTSSLVNRYLNFLDVKPLKGTRLVQIEFETPDPKLSEKLANAHVTGFIRMNIRNRFEVTEEARDFLDAKNKELREKLERSEHALNRFRQTHGVVSLEKGENIIVDRLIDINRQLTTARTQRIDAESLQRTVQNKSAQYLAQVMTQGLIPTLKSNLAGLESERARLSTTFKQAHPRLLELNHQINETRKALNDEMANVVRGIVENYTAVRAKEKALETEAAKQQQIALNLRQVGVDYAVLEEDVKVNRALYESVLKRLSETSISNDLAVSNMRITERAEKPNSPSIPDIPKNLLIGVGFGLFVGIGLAFLLEYLDSTTSTPQEVWGAVGLSTLGVVPNINSLRHKLFLHNHGLGRKLLPHLYSRRPLPPGPDSPTRDLVVADHPLSILADSYRTIRTGLLFSRAERPPQAILITSPASGEGKTVTALNLARVLTQDGNRVLVIDADLRKGTCHARLGMNNDGGLSNILTGNSTLEEGIQETPAKGLFLLSRGVCPPNPSDLLGSKKMAEILSHVRKSFNFILIDSAPSIVVSDAAVLSMISDGVLLVLNGQKSTIASARQAMERLGAVRAPVLGVVLNGINLSNPEYAYYRYYYGSDRSASNIPAKNGAEATVETVICEEPSDLEASLDRLGPGTVAQSFFDRMVSTLTEAAGPMAAVIVEDQIAFLGESRAAFPKNRLGELFKSVSQEILDEQMKRNFRRSMEQDIRFLHSVNGSS